MPDDELVPPPGPDGYAFVGLLAVGGQSEVWHATKAAASGTDYAVKVYWRADAPLISPDGRRLGTWDSAEQRSEQRERAQEAFRQERKAYQLAEGARTDGLLEIEAFVPSDDVLATVTRKCLPLGRFIEEPLPLEEAVVIAIGRQVALALARMHRPERNYEGLVHGDISPANLFYEASSGAVLMGDLGAGFARDTGRSHLPLATHGYSSPQRWTAHDVPPSPNDDQYSLAASLMALVLGSHPRVWEARLADWDEDLTPPFGLSVGFVRTIRRAMSREAGDRFDDCFEFLRALDQVASPTDQRLGVVLPDLPVVGFTSLADYRHHLERVAGVSLLPDWSVADAAVEPFVSTEAWSGSLEPLGEQRLGRSEVPGDPTTPSDGTDASSFDEDRRSLAAQNALAVQLWEEGRRDGAVLLMEEVIADQSRVLGADHPDTLMSRFRHACWLADSRRVEEAVPLLEVLVVDQGQVLGADHPDTLASRLELAYCLAESGRAQAAVSVGEGVVADQMRLLGADDPRTLSSRHSLAHWLGAAGHVEEAVILLEVVVQTSARVLGADDPATLRSRAALANWLKVLPTRTVEPGAESRTEAVRAEPASTSPQPPSVRRSASSGNRDEHREVGPLLVLVLGVAVAWWPWFTVFRDAVRVRTPLLVISFDSWSGIIAAGLAIAAVNAVDEALTRSSRVKFFSGFPVLALTSATVLGIARSVEDSVPRRIVLGLWAKVVSFWNRLPAPHTGAGLVRVLTVVVVLAVVVGIVTAFLARPVTNRLPDAGIGSLAAPTQPPLLRRIFLDHVHRKVGSDEHVSGWSWVELGVHPLLRGALVQLAAVGVLVAAAQFEEARVLLGLLGIVVLWVILRRPAVLVATETRTVLARRNISGLWRGWDLTEVADRESAWQAIRTSVSTTPIGEYRDRHGVSTSGGWWLLKQRYRWTDLSGSGNRLSWIHRVDLDGGPSLFVVRGDGVATDDLLRRWSPLPVPTRPSSTLRFWALLTGSAALGFGLVAAVAVPPVDRVASWLCVAGFGAAAVLAVSSLILHWSRGPAVEERTPEIGSALVWGLSVVFWTLLSWAVVVAAGRADTSAAAAGRVEILLFLLFVAGGIAWRWGDPAFGFADEGAGPPQVALAGLLFWLPSRIALTVVEMASVSAVSSTWPVDVVTCAGALLLALPAKRPGVARWIGIGLLGALVAGRIRSDGVLGLVAGRPTGALVLATSLVVLGGAARRSVPEAGDGVRRWFFVTTGAVSWALAAGVLVSVVEPRLTTTDRPARVLEVGGTLCVQQGGSDTARCLASGDRPSATPAANGLAWEPGQGLRVNEVAKAVATPSPDGEFSCVLRVTGSLACLDASGSRASGWFEEEAMSSPDTVVGGDLRQVLAKDVVDVEAAGAHVCARMRSGWVRCISRYMPTPPGDDLPPLISPGSPLRSPLDVPSVSRATQLESTGTGFCSSSSGGEVRCWNEQLEWGAEPEVVFRPDHPGRVKGEVQGDAMCILTETDYLPRDELRCGSRDAWKSSDHRTEVLVEDFEFVGRHVCAIEMGGTVWCATAETGQGEGETASFSDFSRVRGVAEASRLVLSDDAGCAVAGGTPVCWALDPARDGHRYATAEIGSSTFG